MVGIANNTRGDPGAARSAGRGRKGGTVGWWGRDDFGELGRVWGKNLLGGFGHLSAPHWSGRGGVWGGFGAKISLAVSAIRVLRTRWPRRRLGGIGSDLGEKFS